MPSQGEWSAPQAGKAQGDREALRVIISLQVNAHEERDLEIVTVICNDTRKVPRTPMGKVIQALGFTWLAHLGMVPSVNS